MHLVSNHCVLTLQLLQGQDSLEARLALIPQVVKAAVAELNKAPALAATAAAPCSAAALVQKDAAAITDALSAEDLAAVAASANMQADMDQVRSHLWLCCLLYLAYFH